MELLPSLGGITDQIVLAIVCKRGMAPSGVIECLRLCVNDRYVLVSPGQTSVVGMATIFALQGFRKRDTELTEDFDHDPAFVACLEDLGTVALKFTSTKYAGGSADSGRLH